MGVFLVLYVGAIYGFHGFQHALKLAVSWWASVQLRDPWTAMLTAGCIFSGLAFSIMGQAKVVDGTPDAKLTRWGREIE